MPTIVVEVSDFKVVLRTVVKYGPRYILTFSYKISKGVAASPTC